MVVFFVTKYDEVAEALAKKFVTKLSQKTIWWKNDCLWVQKSSKMKLGIRSINAFLALRSTT